MFQFKQFAVDQSNCAMKINTDGVLLGALAGAGQPMDVLDIGTGTGVIALMLAQRFNSAQVDAVEIDEAAAATAQNNFGNSKFAERLSVYPVGFESFFESHPYKKYDLIVSNPPFYINSLHSPGEKKQLAKHSDRTFFENLLIGIKLHLNPDGVCWLVLPLQTASLVEEMISTNNLHVQQIINICSFAEREPHRKIMAIGLNEAQTQETGFVIYKSENLHTQQYQQALKDFFIIFK